jgi:hypothetical protein
MSLDYRQRCQLRLLRAGIRRSDPLLSALFGMFGRLYKGEGMPPWEQVPTSRDRGRIVAWGLAVLAVMAAAFGAVLTAALVMVTAIRHPWGRWSASRPERARYGAGVGGPGGRLPQIRDSGRRIRPRR